MKIICYSCVLMLWLQCGDSGQSPRRMPSVTPQKNIVQSPAIVIQPFNGLSKAAGMNIANKLKEIYHGRIEIRPSISLPVSAYYAARKRYRADSLINYLGRRAGRGEVIIGLTHQDVSTTKGGNPDYGIMGLGLCPGNACIASTFRLKGVNIPEKLYKVSIHELGHTQGLRHCKVIGCLMRDAEGKDRLDQEHSFCVDCARVLKSKGWAF